MNTQTDINETLAVIMSDLKKLLKHFRLDRRRQAEENATTIEDSAPENETLQQIAATVKEFSERRMLSGEQLDKIINGAGEYLHQKQNNRFSELKPLLEEMAEKLDELPAEPQNSTIRHDHTYIIDFRNSKAVITIVSLAVAFVISFGVNIHQAGRNNALTDSDLKYRYVRMQGEATPDELYYLESLFTFDRNNDSVRIVRRRVEHYERLVKEYNEKQLRIRLNDARVREIEQEAATVKGGK